MAQFSVNELLMKVIQLFSAGKVLKTIAIYSLNGFKQREAMKLKLQGDKELQQSVDEETD